MSIPKSNKLPYPIWEFNYKPERYVHKTWLVDLPNAELLLKLIHINEGDEETKLSHHLMSQLGFNGKFFFDFADPITKLALWPGADLQDFVKYLGVMYYYHEVRQVIERSKVLSYRKALGDDLYTFALERASVLDVTLRPIKLSKSLSIKEKILIAGLLTLYSSMQGYPIALQKRLVIKLPRKWYDYYMEYAHNKNVLVDSESKRKLLIGKVMQELTRAKKKNAN